MVNLKIIYYDRKGTAEKSRLLLLIAGVPFEDFRYKDESEFAAERENFRAIGDLPYLEISKGETREYICNHKSIERFLAKKYGFMGRTLGEEARIDSICEYIDSLREEYMSLGDYQKIRSYKETSSYFNEHFKKHLENLVRIMDTTNMSFSVGNKISLADISLYVLMTTCFDGNRDHALEIAGSIRKIRNILTKVSNLDVVREWTKKYPI